MRLVLAISLCLGLATACGKKDEKAGGGDKAEKAGEGGGAASGKIYNCVQAKRGKCGEYSGDALVAGEGIHKGACAALEGTFGEGACTRDNALGTCDMGKGIVTVYYPTEGDMGNTAESVKSDCETIMEGKFAAAAGGAAPAAPAGGAAPAEGAAPAGGAAPTTP